MCSTGPNPHVALVQTALALQFVPKRPYPALRSWVRTLAGQVRFGQQLDEPDPAVWTTIIAGLNAAGRRIIGCAGPRRSGRASIAFPVHWTQAPRRITIVFLPPDIEAKAAALAW
jgi:hypothetical protein